MTNDTSFVSVTGATSSFSASQPGAASQSKAFVAFCSSNTELRSALVSQPPQPLFVQQLVMAVDADGNEIGQQRGQSMEPPLDPCQGRSERPPVSLQEQQVSSSDPLRGQSAMPPIPVPAQQADSDGEAMASLATGPFVTDQEHGERVTLDEGCNAACHSASWAARSERYFDMFGFQSEYREDTRPKVFTGLGGNAFAAVGRRKFPFALAFTLERDDIHHLSGTTESWELPGDGPFLFPIDAQARLGLIKDMAKSRIFIENKPGFYLRIYKDAMTGLMLINMADFDLLNDQALTPQPLRASKPMYALPATIPPPTSITGGLLAESPSTSSARWRLCRGLPRCVSRTWQLDSTSWTSTPSPMAIFAATSVSDIVDELVTSLLEIEKTARCWSRPCVGDLQRRHAGRTSFILLDCRAFKDPTGSTPRNHRGVRPTTLSKILSHREFPGLLLDLVERVMRLANRDPQAKILIGFICMKARHRSVACTCLMQVIHTALQCSVNTRTTALDSRGRHLCNRDTCPDCSHLSAAAVRLMESVRDRLFPAAGKSWRITEKAPPPQPSKRASFLKGTLEQARFHRQRDRQHRSRIDACVGEGGKVRRHRPFHAARGRPSEGKPCWNRHRLLNGHPWRRKESPGWNQRSTLRTRRDRSSIINNCCKLARRQHLRQQQQRQQQRQLQQQQRQQQRQRQQGHHQLLCLLHHHL